MRPGREAPDNGSLNALTYHYMKASMRPGREAPDNIKVEINKLKGVTASMRPGREAPDNPATGTSFARLSRRFNEAGARSPG